MLDADGYVTSPGGLRLQGYGTNEKGDVNMGALGDLQLGNMKQPAKSTESIDIDLNLSATETPITDPFDPANPTETSHHSTSVTIYDSVGRPIDAEVYYTMTAPGEWSYNVLVDGESLDGGTAGTAQAITSGTLSFDTDGNLTTHTPGATTFNPINATQPQTPSTSRGALRWQAIPLCGRSRKMATLPVSFETSKSTIAVRSLEFSPMARTRRWAAWR